MFFDQRDMLGVETRQEAEERWDKIIRQRGKELRDDERTVNAYVNWGRWVADCPECNGGIAAWTDNPRGACLDCGHVYKVKFPPPKKRAEAEQVLEARSEQHRNWHPDRETPTRLKTENEFLLGRSTADWPPPAHGIGPFVGDV